MEYAVTEWLERQSLRSGNWSSRWLSRPATLLLCRFLTADHDSDASAVVRIACSSPDGWASRRALQVLSRLCDDRRAVHRVVAGLQDACRSGQRTEPRYRLPAAAAALLFAPVPGGPHGPDVRLVRYLDSEPLEGSRPAYMDGRYIASWVVEAVVGAIDAGPRQEAFAVLEITDQPDLLVALTGAFDIGSRIADTPGAGDRDGEVSPYLLWRDGQPTRLMATLLANPHLPHLPPRPPRSDPWHVCRSAVLLAMVKDRPEFVHGAVDEYGAHYAVRSLIEGVALPVPALVAQRCRRALRSFDPGPAQDQVCEQAARGDPEASAAAMDAGYLPTSERARPAFLFLTEQWDRYDELDPDGSLLYAYVSTLDDRDRWWHERILEVASRHGRSFAIPPLLEPRPRPFTGGSWPTGFVGGFGHF
jgi:hypothetical protein